MEKAPVYALLFGFIFLIAGFLLATASPCAPLGGLQVCAPLYQSTGNVLLAFGGTFLVLWVVLIAIDELRPR